MAPNTELTDIPETCGTASFYFVFDARGDWKPTPLRPLVCKPARHAWKPKGRNQRLIRR